MNISEKIQELSCDDIAPKVKKRKRTSYYVFTSVRILLFIACLAVFVFSVKSIIDNFKDYDEGEDFYNEIANNFNNFENAGLTSPIFSADKVVPLIKFDEMLVSDGKLPPVVSNEEMEEFLKTKNKLTLMKNDYPDLYGWINLPNTNINYPIMQGTDNEYYVTHAADGKYNSAGAIFADFRCKKTPQNTSNLVIYGHNIRSRGTMFNGITNFFNENYFKSRPKIEISTFDGIYEYTVIAVFETDIYDNYTKINFSGSNIADFITQTYAKSAVSREMEYDEDSKLITLSTCSNSLDKEKRYAIVGVLTKSITPN